ncbi:Flavohemoprotein [Acetobacteraceae bacterium EV16G]|uniref:nitric oxide dioxygenase n=1 Tax=Sorlinia euscelidii TaxID=3081148 RepID=A0ABU7U4N2_9PROT
MNVSLDDKTRAILTSCLPVLEADGMRIIQKMYARLLVNQEIRDLFNMSHQEDGKQIEALAYALKAFTRHIDNLSELGNMVERIAEKHVGLNIRPRHYPFVADALLGALADILGDLATSEIMEAWGKAYWFLAHILMNREAQIYHEKEVAPGSWTGWRSFTVQACIRESDVVMSLILAPSDGRLIMRHQPGQYLSIHLDIPGHGVALRHYSISSTPDQETYRISVRRADKGLVSSWLHERARPGMLLQVSAPSGEFTLVEPVPKSVILLSAGIGLTPMMSMLGALSEAQSRCAVHYIHVTRSPETEVFAEDISKLVQSGKIRADIFYSRSAPDHVDDAVKRHAGRPTPDWLKNHVDPQATCYVCGPDKFVHDMVCVLRECELPKSQIRYEFFGSASVEELVA